MDLKKFRKIAAGDRLRGQYQGLSQDPNSLSNLDQVCFIGFVLFPWAVVSGWDLGFFQRTLEWDEVLIHHFLFALGKKKTLTKFTFTILWVWEGGCSSHSAPCGNSSNSYSAQQDLPNNMIHQVPIKSLPQEWLWCETWCDDSSKKRAKTIDLVSAGSFPHSFITLKYSNQF